MSTTSLQEGNGLLTRLVHIVLTAARLYQYVGGVRRGSNHTGVGRQHHLHHTQGAQ